MTSTAGGIAGPATDLLAEAIRRVVEVASPERIILFGSAARGETGPDSDLDLLVVKSGVAHRRKLAQRIYRSLVGLEAPVDVLVVTPEDIEAFKDEPGTIIGPALREGRVVYVA